MNQIYVLMNTKTCGYCRKFDPVIRANIKAMNEEYQSNVIIADRVDAGGDAIFKKLGYSGGVPCMIAVKDGQQVAKVPGYKPSDQTAVVLYQMFNL